MTTITHDHSPLGKLGALLFVRQTPITNAERHNSLVESFKAWRERRAAIAELQSLSDRNLADIGLTRDGISGMVGSLRSAR
jgi:uncharacterized protein YjiS (DUF1127 family)